MKKFLSLIISIFFVLSLLPSCTQEQSDKLQVYVSFYALEDFAREIGGDKIDITNLVQTGEPHDFEISATQMARLLDGDLFIYSGTIDTWAQDISDSATSSGCLTIKADGNINLNNEHDPHIWLNPDIAIVQMEQICNALCEIDENNKDFYTNNLNSAREKCSFLKEQIALAKPKTNSHTIITAHGAYAHLLDLLGITQLSIEGIHGEGDPTAAQMAKIIDFARENNIKHIFVSPNENSKSAQSVANEVGAKILYLDSLEVDNQNGGYFSAMEKNIEEISNSVMSN